MNVSTIYNHYKLILKLYSILTYYRKIQILNHICIAITLNDKLMKSNKPILQWCNLKMYIQNQDMT